MIFDANDHRHHSDSIQAVGAAMPEDMDRLREQAVDAYWTSYEIAESQREELLWEIDVTVEDIRDRIYRHMMP